MLFKLVYGAKNMGLGYSVPPTGRSSLNKLETKSEVTRQNKRSPDSGGFLSPTWTMVLLKLQSEVVDTTLSALQCRANGVRP